MMQNLALRGAVIAAISCAAGLAVGSLSAANDIPAGTAVVFAAIAVAATAAVGLGSLASVQVAMSGVAAAARRIGGAEFSERVVPTGGAGAELTSNFNTMARRVQGLFAEVSAEHARLEAVIDASADAMVALSKESTVRFLNPAALAMFETTFPAAIGRPLIETVRDYELDALVKRVAAGAPGEDAVISFGPRRTTLRAVAAPVPDGGDWAVLLVLADLTELTRIDQVRRDFLSNVSHELRTPLASIRALAETLEEGAVEPGEETAEFVTRIREQADRLTSLVNEFLELSRIESGAIELRPERIDLSALVADSEALMRQRLADAGLRVERQGGEGTVVEGDRPSLLRVVTNLLDNAIKFSPPGAAIVVDVRDEGDLAALSVTDDGPGIEPQDLPRVFERFYKGDPSRAKQGNTGVGLGLAIVKHTVRLHGGTVEATSRPGEGATFTVRLPKRFLAGRRAVPRS